MPPQVPFSPTLVLSILAAILAGCAANEIPNDLQAGRFLSNGAAVFVNNDEAKRLAETWPADSVQMVSSSKLPRQLRRWTLNFIALSHAQGTNPCRSLKLESILELPLAPFQYQSEPGGPIRSARPEAYFESWLVLACGSRTFWRVFRDADNRNGTPTAMLWRQL